MVALAAVLALLPFGHDHYVSRDAGWCWFADPRAIWVDGTILSGGVTSAGDVVTSDYDPKTKVAKVRVLAKGFEKDDHDNPSFLQLKDRRVLAFFSKHGGPDMWMTERKPGGEWATTHKINANDTALKGTMDGYCYPNPQQLSGEKGRIYLFWRGMNWKPSMSWSDDQGKTWAKGKMIVSPEGESSGVRPYVKVAGDGRSRVDMAFTDGHPRNEAKNSIYFVRMEKGAFRHMDGTPIATFDQLPFRPNQADVIYDGKATGVRSWIWDISHDPTGNPVVVYARLPKEDQHIYHYARWDGAKWVDHKITEAGKWFPDTPAGTTEREPHYSGGVTLDPNDTRFVYLSRPINGRWEIERWFTADGGEHWSHVGITGASKHNSIRPFVVRGKRPAGVGPNAVWVNANRYAHYTDYASTQQAADEDRGPWDTRKPERVMNAMWRWVRSNPSSYVKTEWMLAPLYSGVLNYAALTKNDEATNWVISQCEANNWKLGPRPFMADDQAVGQAYLQLGHPEAVKEWADALLARPHDESLLWVNNVHNREWAWCDSLFMAPPALAMLAKQTGDRRYTDLLTRLWKKTSDYLYDPAESLYFRDSRYFKSKEANGQKMFWSRGNGWVMGGLVRVLDALPAGDPSRAMFETQFKQMAARIAKLQTKDGTWHASLLDPASFPNPESSGTGFYCYSLAWGIRHGLLDSATYRPVVNRAFKALVGAVDPNGHLGWVQPIGQDPKKVLASDTETYGVGAFFLAATEVSQLK